MVIRSQPALSRAYPYGADGSAFSPQIPISSSRPLAYRAKRTQPLRGRTMSLGAVLVALAMVAAVFCFHALALRSERTGLSKDISGLQTDLSLTEDRIDLLEIDIEKASNPTAIHTAAVNLLGMSLPTDERIITIALPPSP